MSTCYYYLREPITRVDVRRGDFVVTMDLFVGTDNIGAISVCPAQESTIMMLLCDGTDANPPVIYSGGHLHERKRRLDPDLQLISEYHELTSLRALRKEFSEETP